MLKSIQIRIMLIIILLSIIMFVTCGLLYINQIEQMHVENVSTEIIEREVRQVQILIVAFTVSFVVISSIIIIVASRIIISPISRLIKNAQKIADGEEVEVKLMEDRKSKYGNR